MTRSRLVKAVATRDSIANLWTLTELQGEVTIHCESRRHAYLIRNKLYAHRSMLRKSAAAHTGTAASTLDGYKISFGPLEGYDEGEENNKWWLTITYHDIVEFELVVDDTVADEKIPHFDVIDDEHPRSFWAEDEETVTFDPEEGQA